MCRREHGAEMHSFLNSRSTISHVMSVQMKRHNITMCVFSKQNEDPVLLWLELCPPER